MPTTASLVTLTEFDVPIPMRDGVVLRANITRPADGTPAPVILMRSPYPLEGVRYDVDAIGLARRGLALVVQSTRGTGASDGDFEPWVNEQNDGADSIAWCAEQPWSTGSVATYGRSYLAHAQVYAAGARPPTLKAMGLGMVPSDPYDLTYSGGVLALGSTLFWAMGMAGNLLARRAMRGEDVADELDELAAAMSDFPGLYRTTPLADIPILDKHFPSWRKWLEHPERDEWWQARAVPGRGPIPTMVVAGWHDLFLSGSLRQFAQSKQHPDSRLFIGPWSHGMPNSALGDVDYGGTASGIAIGLDAEFFDFLNGHVRGDTPADASGGSVRQFVMGSGRWREEPTWPPAGTIQMQLFLGAGGRLSDRAQVSESAPSTFVFDPRDPVPTVGGPNMLPTGDAANASGSCDQRPLDIRQDVLRFATEPLAADVDVIGQVSVTLFAATSAADTDWTAKLVDVCPDGQALNIVDGIVRARYRDPSRGEELLEPNRPHEFVIELGATAQRFEAGHCIRIDISSSNFPRFDRNPGTGSSSAETAEEDFVIAYQSVLHGPEHPSRLTMPVVQS